MERIRMSQHEDPNFIIAFVKSLLGSAIVLLMFWGALGGVTNALVTRVSVKEAVRLILLGAVIAAGMGSLATAFLAAWFNLPGESLLAIGGAAGSTAYLVGVFGSAIFEVVLGRIRTGKLPGEKGE
jgi:hypothetical protein